MNKKHWTICVSLFFLVSGFLSAKNVEVRFSVVNFLGDSQILQLKDGSEIQLNPKYPSKSVKLRLGKEGSFYLYAEDVDPDDTDTKPVSEVKIPSNCSSANVLLIPVKSKGVYNSIVIDDSELKGGGIFFLNATAGDIGVNLAGSESLIKAKKTLLLPYSKATANNSKVSLYNKKGADWRKFYTSVWRLIPGRKEVMIFYQNPGSKIIRYKGITDY
jgi:hypothetical protein